MRIPKNISKAFYDKTLWENFSKIFPSFGYYNSDIIIASYPKSGRNWLLFMIANAICLKQKINLEINFHNIHQLIPQRLTSKPTIEGYPRIIALHKNNFSRKCRVIYLIRHPGDVMVSYYDYIKNRRNIKVNSFSEFIRSEKYGISNWVDHAVSLQNRYETLIKFEDLKRSTLLTITPLLSDYFGIKDKSIIKKAIEYSSISKMRHIEKKAGLPYKPGFNNNYQFVRAGEFNKGKTHFGVSDYKYLVKKTNKIIKRLGYY